MTGAADTLQIAGLVPMSTCDWPGRIVATVFLQGCPWQCTYCHNPALLDSRTPGSIPWGAVRELLGRRRGLLDGVVFSGGEPTRQPALVAAAREVRDLGFGVGLHTAGAFPGRLRSVLPLVDWVGLDIKASPEQYGAITGIGASAASAYASLAAVLEAGVHVQVRTTVDPTVQGPDDVAELQERLAALGIHDHVIQTVRPLGTRPEYAERLAARAFVGTSVQVADIPRSPGRGRDLPPSRAPARGPAETIPSTGTPTRRGLGERTVSNG